MLLGYSWDDGFGENKFINTENGFDPMYVVRIVICGSYYKISVNLEEARIGDLDTPNVQ